MTKETDPTKPTPNSENRKGWFRPKVSTIEINFDAEERLQYEIEEDAKWAKKHKGAPVLMMSND
jgi:hypothetical protein